MSIGLTTQLRIHMQRPAMKAPTRYTPNTRPTLPSTGI
ncbi:hypothetical protein EVA_09361 [gut metagenome]|uniref:Uncharacterized protein n=1 Tax=gut metagenome TaxID=749906 RepID=J9G5R6_9ZZZZ